MFPQHLVRHKISEVLTKAPWIKLSSPPVTALVKKLPSLPIAGHSSKDVLPQNKIWRTGANEATEIRLFADVQFGDTKVSAGTYSVFTIVGEKSVTFILNRGTNLWGAYAYSSKKDVLRMDVPRATAKESLEAFSIAFSNKEEQPKIHMGWGNVRLAIPFTVL